MPSTPPPVGAIQPLWTQASHLKALKSYAAAVEVYEQIADLKPQDSEPFLAIGDIYLVQHRWILAEDAFNRALARDGENVHALDGLATARWEQGDQPGAITLWETVLARRSTSYPRPESKLSPIRIRLALAYLDTDRPAEAQATFHRELTHADNPVAHLYLAMIEALDDAKGARRELEAIPDDASPAVIDARDYMLTALDQAEAADTAAGAAKSLGLALVQIEEWQLAHAALERALMLEPSDAEAMAFLGHTQSQLGRPAFSRLSASVQARPDWPLGHYLLGLYFLKQGAYRSAADEFLATLQLDPGNAQAQVDLARAYVGLRDYLTAEQALVEAVESEPDDLTFHLALVRFYADHTLGVTDRGLAAAQVAADLAPEDPQVYDLLGWMYLLAGDPSLARSHLENALQLEPELVSAHYHLGVLYNALGREEEARTAFSRAIDLDTEGFYRDHAQRALREMSLGQQ
jgi:tetratricopeptide (TPR) repeat protein